MNRNTNTSIREVYFYKEVLEHLVGSATFNLENKMHFIPVIDGINKTVTYGEIYPGCHKQLRNANHYASTTDLPRWPALYICILST